MVKVLFDHNMPPSIARALNELIKSDGHSAFPLREKFKTDIGDIELFITLAKDGDWIVISKDVANAKRAPERAAILRSGVLAFYLAPAVQKQRVNEQAATIIWQWDKVVQQRANNKNGLFLLPVNKGSQFTAL